MYRSLGELQDAVSRLIEEQGIDSPCASFIYTKNDVYSVDEDDSEVACSDEVVESVLSDVGNSGWIYTQISNLIDDSVSEYNR